MSHSNLDAREHIASPSIKCNYYLPLMQFIDVNSGDLWGIGLAVGSILGEL